MTARATHRSTRCGDLHHLHPQAIPFENLDPLLRRPVKLDPASLQAKLVGGGRGGYCFEHNSLFAQVLRALGFKVQEATARVRWSVPPGVRTPRVHCLLFVEAEGERVSRRCRLRRQCADRAAQARLARRAGDAARAVPAGRRGRPIVVEEAKINGAWTPLYAFDFADTHPADYEMGNWFTSAHPESIFVNGLLGARAEPGRRYALREQPARGAHAQRRHREEDARQRRRVARRAHRSVQAAASMSSTASTRCWRGLRRARHEPARPQRPAPARRRQAEGRTARPRSRP